MADVKQQPATATPNKEQAVAAAVAKTVFGEKKGGDFKGRPRKFDRDNRNEKRDDMDQRMLEVARVTRVMKGGKRMSFRACVAIGDKKGSIGIGLGKGADVTMAVNKAVNQAKKKLIKVVTVNDTIPHEVYERIGAAKILFKPAKKGRGVIAGGVVRVILELAGIKNITSKILGTNNKINNARCTIAALKRMKKSDRPVKSAKPEVKVDKSESAVKKAK